MDDKGLLIYIWDTKANRVIIILLVIIILTAFLTKFLIWNELTLVPFIFFGIVIPLQLLFINSIPYKFYKEWVRIQKDYSDKLTLRKDIKVYIKNFWPWKEMTKLKNMGRALDMPNYDFDKADILESKDLIVIRGYSENFFLGLFKPKTRPFVITLADTKVKDYNLYQVNLTSVNETEYFKEFTFIDNTIGVENPITIKIYKDK
ncbi:MAG: hypothetical protein O9294_18025 [Cytophagales bacterium]|jgi:hypothetical protein|nr:hypothetical protein [Cytophagales bacterium]